MAAVTCLLCDEGEPSLGISRCSVTGLRIRHRFRRRARASGRCRRRSGATSCSPASARATRNGSGARVGILCFNVESASELDTSPPSRAKSLRAPVGFRVNPDVDPETHPYISTGLKESKFGVASAAVARTGTRRGCRWIAVRGIDIHIGSQITDSRRWIVKPPVGSVALVDALAAEGIALAHIDLGGGLGIRCRVELPVAIGDYAAMVRALDARAPGEARARAGSTARRRCRCPADPRARREERAARNFAIVDAAMNDLLRPSLYGAWHAVDPVRLRPAATCVTTSSARSARAATSLRTIARSRSPKAISSPCAARAHTGCR